MSSAKEPLLDVKQLKVLLIFFLVGDIAWFLPSLAVTIVKQDAWFVAIVGTLAGWGVAAFVYWFAQQFPGMSLVAIHRQALGRYAGGLLTLLFVLSQLSTASAEVRALGQFTTTQIMTDTPMRVILLFFSLVVLAAVSVGLQAIARTAQLFFTIFLIIFVLLVALLLSEIQPSHLLPVLHNGTGDLARGSLFMATFPYFSLISFLMIFPDVEQDAKRFRSYMTAIMIGGAIIITLVVLSLLVLGSFMTEQQIYSTYIMAKKISIGNFLQRLEFILIISYVLSTFFKCVIAVYATHRCLIELFRLKDGKLLLYPLGLTLFGYSYVISPDIVFLNTLALPWGLWEMTNMLLLVVFVYAVYLISGKKKSGPPAA